MRPTPCSTRSKLTDLTIAICLINAHDRMSISFPYPTGWGDSNSWTLDVRL
jgi:hypothetical protein